MADLLYPNHWKVKDALQAYFSKYHFENGGYHLKWFKIKLGPVFIPLPNTKGRIEAVKIHDIHHLLTEYPATLKGEAEIGAWEIASGCGPYVAAWVLNFGSFFYGMICYPRAVHRAFMRGRSISTNLYHGVEYDEQLLRKEVGEVRRFVGFDFPRVIDWRDLILFQGYCFLVAVAAILFFYFFLYCLPRVLFWA